MQRQINQDTPIQVRKQNSFNPPLLIEQPRKQDKTYNLGHDHLKGGEWEDSPVVMCEKQTWEENWGADLSMDLRS